MNWYLQSGKEADVAFSSKIKLARNINGYPFELEDARTNRKFRNKNKRKFI